MSYISHKKKKQKKKKQKKPEPESMYGPDQSMDFYA